MAGRERHDNGAMQRAPFLVTTAVVAGPIALVTHLAVEPEPFAPDAAAVAAAGLLLFAVVAAAGLLLSRGRWALRLSLGLVAIQFVLGMFVDIGPWAVASFALGLAALAGLTGPWLRGWTRRRPAAGGPGPRPMFLLLGSLALVPGVAAASPSGLGWQHGVLAGLGLVAAWGYSRAGMWGLWLLRLALAPAAIAAIAISPALGAAYLAVHVTALAGVAWTREALLAICPLLDRVYGPRSARPNRPNPKGRA